MPAYFPLVLKISISEFLSFNPPYFNIFLTPPYVVRIWYSRHYLIEYAEPSHLPTSTKTRLIITYPIKPS